MNVLLVTSNVAEPASSRSKCAWEIARPFIVHERIVSSREEYSIVSYSIVQYNIVQYSIV